MKRIAISILLAVTLILSGALGAFESHADTRGVSLTMTKNLSGNLITGADRAKDFSLHVDITATIYPGTYDWNTKVYLTAQGTTQTATLQKTDNDKGTVSFDFKLKGQERAVFSVETAASGSESVISYDYTITESGADDFVLTASSGSVSGHTVTGNVSPSGSMPISDFAITLTNTKHDPDKPVGGPVYGGFEVRKTEKGNPNRKLQGVTFLLENYSGQDVVMADGTVFTDGSRKYLTTDVNGVARIEGLPFNQADGGMVYRYHLEETNPPFAPNMTYTPIDGEVSNNLYIIDVENELDGHFYPQVSKKAVGGSDELPGAVLQVTGSWEDGSPLEITWTSGEEPHVIALPEKDGAEYTLREITPPAGYIRQAPVYFRVARTWNSRTDEYDYYVEVQGEDGIYTRVNTVTLYDDWTKVTISKRDETGENRLPGAVLRLLDARGRIVDEWETTADEDHRLEKKLEAGMTYTLREVTAPEGYVPADDMVFTVSDDGKEQLVTLVNVRAKEPDVPTPTPSPDETTSGQPGRVTKAPKTGDAAMAGTALLLMTASLTGLWAARRRKQER